MIADTRCVESHAPFCPLQHMCVAQCLRHNSWSCHRKGVDIFFHLQFLRKAHPDVPVQLQPVWLLDTYIQWHPGHLASLNPSRYRTYASASHLHPYCQGQRSFHPAQQQYDYVLERLLSDKLFLSLWQPYQRSRVTLHRLHQRPPHHIHVPRFRID